MDKTNMKHPGEYALRWRLRQLPREREPGRDLWPGIAARVATASPLQARSHPAPRWIWAVAAAASLALAVGLVLRQELPFGAPNAVANQSQDALLRQADALSTEYRAALSQFDGAVLPDPIEPTLRELDSSAEQIRTALHADPDAVFLLDQLRRTYARRLELTQRALVG